MSKKNVDKRYGTREERINRIKSLAMQLGYTPRKSDVPIVEMIMIKQHYSVWTHVVRDAGLEDFTSCHQCQLRQMKLNERLDALSLALHRGESDSNDEEYEFLKQEFISNTKTKTGNEEIFDGRISKDHIRNYLRELAEWLGYSPTISSTYHTKQILRHYDSWFEALADAGLEKTNTERQRLMRERIQDLRFRELLHQRYVSLALWERGTCEKE